MTFIHSVLKKLWHVLTEISCKSTVIGSSIKLLRGGPVFHVFLKGQNGAVICDKSLKFLCANCAVKVNLFSGEGRGKSNIFYIFQHHKKSFKVFPNHDTFGTSGGLAPCPVPLSIVLKDAFVIDIFNQIPFNVK